jgi:hypothetical protein
MILKADATIFIKIVDNIDVPPPPPSVTRPKTLKTNPNKKLIKRKKKADFNLPSPSINHEIIIKSLPQSRRLSRRISNDFVPIFDVPHEEDLLTPKSRSTTTTTTSAPRPARVSSLPVRNSLIQPRGEGYRLKYRPQQQQAFVPTSNGGFGRRQVPLTRRRFETRPNPGGRFYVVKKRRRPNSVSSNRRNEVEDDVEVEAAVTSVNYQTDNTFHHEAVLDNGERHGEYGYIDPIGVRRVVTYATGPGQGQGQAQGQGGILKAKENDFVGPNTYFEAN